MMANRFGFTPVQVDQIPYDRAVYLLEIETEHLKKQQNDSR